MNESWIDQFPLCPAGRSGWPWTSELSVSPPTIHSEDAWPRITIITPLYNQAEFVEETIRSVLLQGYPNLEYILIDDSSTDGGMDVVEKYEAWLTIIKRPRGSQANAINHGFSIASGDLIAWQNSDDIYGENCLFHAAVAAMNNPTVSVFHGTAKCFWDANISGPYTNVMREDFTQEALLDYMCIMNQSMFIRRIIVDSGVRLREDLRYVFDQYFFWELSMKGFGFCLVQEAIGYYRWHRSSITFSPSSNILADRQLFDMQCELLRDERLSSEIRVKIRAKLWASFFSAVKSCRRNIFYKIVPELISPIR